MPRRQPPPRYNVVVMLKEQHVKNQIPSHEHKLQLTRGIQETEKGIDVRFRHFACKTFSNAEQKPSRESIISVTPVIYTAMIDTTIGICAHLIVIMMALCFRVCRAPFAISDHFTMVADL